MTTTTKTRTSPVVRSSSDPLRLDRGETVHVGVDVHKCTYHVAVASNRRGLIATWVQPARPQVLLERLQCIRRASPRWPTRPGRLASPWHAASRPRATRPGSSPPRSCCSPSAPRPRATGSTAAGWRCWCRRDCCGPCGSPPNRRRPTARSAAGRTARGEVPHRPAADQGVPPAARHRRASRPGELVEASGRGVTLAGAVTRTAVLPGRVVGRAGARRATGDAGDEVPARSGSFSRQSLPGERPCLRISCICPSNGASRPRRARTDGTRPMCPLESSSAPSHRLLRI